MRFLINAFVVIFALASIGIAVKFYQSSVHSTEELNKERYDRMVAEEKLTSLDSRVNSLEIDLARSKNESDTSQRRLKELRKESETAKAQAELLNREKEELEAKLNELKGKISAGSSAVAIEPFQY